MSIMNKKNAEVFSDWTPREISALERATALLRLKQGSKKSQIVKPTIKGCYYNSSHHCYIINFYDGIRRVYAGRMAEWSESEAIKIQDRAKAKYNPA